MQHKPSNFRAFVEGLAVCTTFKYVDKHGDHYDFDKTDDKTIVIHNVATKASHYKSIADFSAGPAKGWVVDSFPSEKAASAAGANPSPARCSCQLVSLLQQGCSCGHWQRYNGGLC